MFSVGEVDVKGLRRFENMLGALGADAPKAVARAINHTGDKARTQVIRALSRQTGLPQRIIRTAIKDGPETRRASPESPTYTLSAGGGDVRVKFFKKRETRAGVVAHLGTVRGRTLFPRTFFRGGAFPRRVDIAAFDGHVLDRVSEFRYHLRHVRSGVFIPVEMVEGASAKAFEDSVENDLPRRLDHEISRLLAL